MKRIAIVDDCPIVRGVLRFMIPNAECNLFCYSDPTELLSDVNSNKWDAVITDYDMPQLNGYELVKAIRKISPDTKVIMLSANRKIPKTHPDIYTYIVALLFKPFSRSTLLQAVRTIF
jgi:DNA-binding NtrC family response regulator